MTDLPPKTDRRLEREFSADYFGWPFATPFPRLSRQSPTDYTFGGIAAQWFRTARVLEQGFLGPAPNRSSNSGGPEMQKPLSRP